MICWGFIFVFECQQAITPPSTVCPYVSAWSKAYQIQLAQELEKLPRNSAIWRSTKEHIHLRDRARKCRSQ